MMAYSGVSYTQRVVGTRQRFLDLKSNGQLPFGQLPLLQIDGVEIVQSQVCAAPARRRNRAWAVSVVCIDMWRWQGLF